MGQPLSPPSPLSPPPSPVSPSPLSVPGSAQPGLQPPDPESTVERPDLDSPVHRLWQTRHQFRADGGGGDGLAPSQSRSAVVSLL